MKKGHVQFACTECGYASVRWLGKCPNCGAWNSMAEEVATPGRKTAGVSAEARRITEISAEDILRAGTGIHEFDRVLGGGIVPGSVILLAGEPGVGKSTLLLSVAGRFAAAGKTVLYVSGEESLTQVKLRAQRLGTLVPDLYMLSTTEMPSVRDALQRMKPDLVIVDSIQVVYDPEIPTTPGSVAQVRENTNFFTHVAKTSGVPVFLVGHITKEGAIAGPKILEHMVDVVLYFEGELRSNLRILRSMKNRFGATTEIGVFSMEEQGMKEIPEASGLFLQQTGEVLPGATIFPSQEGKRTILVEIQGLVTATYYGIPKRSVTGLDFNRVSLILAVLEKKLHFNFGTHDVYVNAGGGLRVEEPGCDLAIAVSCVSSLRDLPPRAGTVVMGEIALTGEIRPIGHVGLRLKEAERLGFRQAVVPQESGREGTASGIEVLPVRWLREAIDLLIRT